MIPAPGIFANALGPVYDSDSLDICKCPRTHLSSRGTAEGPLGRVPRQAQILHYPLLHPAIFERVVEPPKFARQHVRTVEPSKSTHQYVRTVKPTEFYLSGRTGCSTHRILLINTYGLSNPKKFARQNV